MAERRVVAEIGAITAATRWAEAELAAAGAPPALCNAAGVCIEEALANLVLHAAAAGPSPDKAIVMAVGGTSARTEVTISDGCVAFDLTRAAVPDRPGLSNDVVGGHGIRLIRRLASGIAYDSAGGRNTLTLTFDTAAFL